MDEDFQPCQIWAASSRPLPVRRGPVGASFMSVWVRRALFSVLMEDRPMRRLSIRLVGQARRRDAAGSGRAGFRRRAAFLGRAVLPITQTRRPTATDVPAERQARP
jgi:hypothetical protein